MSLVLLPSPPRRPSVPGIPAASSSPATVPLLRGSFSASCLLPGNLTASQALCALSVGDGGCWDSQLPNLRGILPAQMLFSRADSGP